MQFMTSPIKSDPSVKTAAMSALTTAVEMVLDGDSSTYKMWLRQMPQTVAEKALERAYNHGFNLFSIAGAIEVPVAAIGSPSLGDGEVDGTAVSIISAYVQAEVSKAAHGWVQSIVMTVQEDDRVFLVVIAG